MMQGHLICARCWAENGRLLVFAGPLRVGCCWCGKYVPVWQTESGSGAICEDVHLDDVR